MSNGHGFDLQCFRAGRKPGSFRNPSRNWETADSIHLKKTIQSRQGLFLPLTDRGLISVGNSVFSPFGLSGLSNA